MNMSLIEKRDNLIKGWLETAAKEIKAAIKNGFDVETKSSRTDLVTNMDRHIEEQFVQQIRKHFPDDKIVSEEGFGDDIDTIDISKDTVWFLDPIDGTMNFVLQKENFATMLAVYKKGIGQQSYIFDIESDKLYWAIKGRGVYCNDQLLPKMEDTPLEDGLFASNSMYLSEKQVALNAEFTKRSMGVRTIGSAGIEATEIVKGSSVVYVSYNLKPWDIAPGLMMIEENGGVVTTFEGETLNILQSNRTIMGTPAAAKEALKILK